ncbi:MAG: hypothetical protein M1828_007340 [Chrysothrix sp. TS-e1954]|nr:MAG: hypothetical protein M1828_007340 [Chrysothrix sp. TS-e1954]
MRNLRVIAQSRVTIEGPLAQVTWDSTPNDTEDVICAIGPTRGHNPIIQLRRYTTIKVKNGDTNVDTSPSNPPSPTDNSNDGRIIAAWDAPCPLPELENDEVLLLHDLGDRLSVVLAGGDIVVVRKTPASHQEKIEIVGSVDVGIIAAEWSFDDSLLAVITRANTFLLMTPEYDNIVNYELTQGDANLSKAVSVGWGKVETQFKGKRAKALRDPTVPETVDEGVPSKFDRDDVTISWRGDGAYVAVNSRQCANRRIVRVFSRDGALDSVSEPIDGLEGALSWRPDGALLSGLQRLHQEVKVVFFERNGLRHGEFSLRPQSSSEIWQMPIDLHWNRSSSILAVSFVDRVQLWTMSNYHYYLKQEIFAPSNAIQSRPLSAVWHPQDPYSIACWQNETNEEASKPHQQAICGTVVVARYSSVPTPASTISPFDIGLQATIDGCNVKLTPLALANIPPPMALHTLIVDNCVVDVAVNTDNTMIAVLQRDCVSLFSGKDRLSRKQSFHLDDCKRLPSKENLVATQIAYSKDELFLVLFVDFEAGAQVVYSLKHATFTQCRSDDAKVSIKSIINDDHTCQLHGRTVSSLSEHDVFNGITSEKTSFPENLHDFACMKISNKIMTFGLSASGILYADSQQLLSNCTSFVLTQSYLVLTTSSHLLKFVHLVQDAANLAIPPDQPELDERCRSIERGARLVAIMPSRFSVVLQMPRGNLETIYPRALVVAGIRSDIESQQYGEAFLACRSHRVDMNILYDFAPQQFLECIPRVVDQLQKMEHIDLFLSQLRDEDVTKSLYRDTIPRTASANVTATPSNTDGSHKKITESTTSDVVSKVNTICDAFLRALQKRYSTNLQNVITAHLCKSPPAIEDGLRVIIDLNETQPELVDHAVEHVCFLADVNRIYEAALGLYDLRLALLVAQQSQKDPREYLPYLQSLQDMPELRKKFRIDDDLGRRSKALSSLHALNVFDEVKRYTEKHEMYKEAIELYRYDQTHQTTLLKSYADYLSSRNRYNEAAIAFESLHDYQSASDAYRAVNLWRECLSSAQLAHLPTTEVTALAQSLATSLAETKDYIAVATIHLDYLSDLETALQNLCKGCQFAEATRLAASKQRADLLESVIDPGLIEASASLTELLADCKAQLNAQVPRLRELRAKKAADPLAFFEGSAVNGEGVDIPDNISLAPSDSSTTGGTLLTQYTQRAGSGTLASNTTRRTSKNRRREERKRARGKKGSVYEEEYLVNSIGRLIERVNSVADDVTRTVEGCLKRGMRERALAVEKSMSEVVEGCKECLTEVWEVREKAQAGAMEDPNESITRDESAWGADDVYRDSIESWKRSGPPTVKAYERSPLL